jgi:phosphopantetheine--protein transferase-like protein
MPQTRWNEIQESLPHDFGSHPWIAVVVVMPPGTGGTQSVIAHSLLRLLVSNVLTVEPASLELATGAHGKPYLANAKQSLHFNLSHCPTHVLVAISNRHEIGADIETIGEYKPRVAHRILPPDEFIALDRLAGDERARAFYRVWVIKEACVKATGTGLSTPLRDIEVSADDRGRWSDLSWQILDAGPNVMACVATRAPAIADTSGRVYLLDLPDALERL